MIRTPDPLLRFLEQECLSHRFTYDDVAFRINERLAKRDTHAQRDLGQVGASDQLRETLREHEPYRKSLPEVVESFGPEDNGIAEVRAVRAVIASTMLVGRVDVTDAKGFDAVQKKSNAVGNLFQRKPIEKGLESQDVSDRYEP